LGHGGFKYDYLSLNILHKFALFARENTIEEGFVMVMILNLLVPIKMLLF